MMQNVLSKELAEVDIKKLNIDMAVVAHGCGGGGEKGSCATYCS